MPDPPLVYLPRTFGRLQDYSHLRFRSRWQPWSYILHVLGSAGPSDTSPYGNVNHCYCLHNLPNTNHGSLTDQFKKTAANPSSMISVIIELPFLKSKPPMAGKRANASGAESQCEGSRPWLFPFIETLGNSRSSVEDLKAFLASSREKSVRVELRRRIPGLSGTSADMLARFGKERCRCWTESSPGLVEVVMGGGEDEGSSIIFRMGIWWRFWINSKLSKLFPWRGVQCDRRRPRDDDGLIA